jgi:alkylation response protein AidB-like acyl-CoA dehydrogenase
MDLTLTADQRDLRTGLRDYLRDTWDADALRAASDDPVLDTARWRELAELGVFGIALPEDDGGMGLGMAEAVLLYEELGHALVPGPLTASFLAAGLLPGVADGTRLVTSIDLRDPVPVAEHLGAADDLIVVDDDGLRVFPVEDVAAVSADVPLDPLTPVARVTVPQPDAGERIGTAQDAARWRLRGALLTAAQQVGVAQGALDLAVRYAGQRVQFDRPIGSFQAVKHLLSEALVRVDLARAAVLVAALRLDDPDADWGEPPEGAVSAAKVLADDAGAQCGRVGIQVHGGMGFTWEVLAHLFLKRAWALETAYGSADEHARRLADAY